MRHDDLGMRHYDLGRRHYDLGVRHYDLGVRQCDLGVRQCDLGVRHNQLGMRHDDLGMRRNHAAGPFALPGGQLGVLGGLSWFYVAIKFPLHGELTGQRGQVVSRLL